MWIWGLASVLVACGGGSRPADDTLLSQAGVSGSPGAAVVVPSAAAGGAPTAGVGGRGGDVVSGTEPPVGAPACTGPWPVMRARDRVQGVELEPDWSCYATPPRSETPAASAGPTRPVTLRAIAVLPSVVEGLMLDVFFAPTTLGTPALARTFMSDSVTIDVPTALTAISLRVHARDVDDPLRALIELREYNVPIETGSEVVEALLMLEDQLALIQDLALGDAVPDPSWATIMSLARDCQGHDLTGAQFELIDGESGAVVPTGNTPGLPRSSYLQNALPTMHCTYTSNEQAAWLMLGAPVNVREGKVFHPYRLRMKGRKNATDAEPVVLDERPVELVSGSTTLVRMDRSRISTRL
ncbi:MAG: hypothetical protein ABW321_06460 [Polyangiales bacterium]